MATVIRLPARRPSRAQPRLSADDLDALRRATAQAHHVLHLILEGAGGRETRQAAYSLTEQLAAWHRRCEPHLYARNPGDRP